MKKVLFGIALALGMFSCSTSDELVPLSQKEDMHSFEFNAHTEIPTASPTGKGANVNYTLIVEAFVDGNHKIATKTFTSNISTHFNYKFETNYAGNVELKVTVSPVTTIVKNISFIPVNEVTKETGKYIEFEQLPTTGILTAVYNKEAKEISTATPDVQYHEVDKDFGDKLTVVKTEEIFNGKTESDYRTFTFDNSGKLFSSFSYKSEPESKKENSVLVYEGGKVIKVINNETSIEEFKYDNLGNIVEGKNVVEQYYDVYRYNEAGKVREMVSNGLNHKETKSYDYASPGKVIVTKTWNNQSLKMVYLLNDNQNPMMKTVPEAFLKTLSTDDKSNYNVTSQYTFGYEGQPENDPNAVTFTYEKDTKGRVVKQIAAGKEEIEGERVTFKRVTVFQYMAQ
jgi:hypothetical protein